MIASLKFYQITAKVTSDNRIRFHCDNDKLGKSSGGQVYLPPPDYHFNPGKRRKPSLNDINQMQ